MWYRRIIKERTTLFGNSKTTISRGGGAAPGEIAGSILGYKHTEETLAKLRARRHSEETRKKMSDAKIGLQAGENNPFFGKNHSDETKQKMSEARKGCLRAEGSGRPSQKVEVFDLTTDIKTTYDSISDAARALGVRKSGISMYLNRNTDNPFKGRYILKKINNL